MAATISSDTELGTFTAIFITFLKTSGSKFSTSLWMFYLRSVKMCGFMLYTREKKNPTKILKGT